MELVSCFQETKFNFASYRLGIYMQVLFLAIPGIAANPQRILLHWIVTNLLVFSPHFSIIYYKRVLMKYTFQFIFPLKWS